MQYIKDMGLGGTSIYALSMDDFRGLCGEKYPLLSVIRRSLSQSPSNTLPSVTAPQLVMGRCEKEGLYSDPKDCAAYFVCRAGHSYRVKCKQGAMFDTEEGICLEGLRVEKCRPGVAVYVSSLKYVFYF